MLEKFPEPEAQPAGIAFHSEDRPVPDYVREEKKQIEDWIRMVAEEYSHRIERLHVYFCSDEFLLRMNREFLGHDFYTDILTFPENSGSRNELSGNLYISLDRLKENTEELGLDYCNEILRVIIHGVLHLTGQDDAAEEDRDQMRMLEDEALNLYYSK